MTDRTRNAIAPLLLGLALVASACGRGERGANDGMPGMPGADAADAMPADPNMMRRHADEAAPVAARMRAHVQEMRALGPQQWHARMADHTGRVSETLTLMSRQMREMDMGMGMSDEAMGAMMGMSAEEYRRTLELMAAVRADAEGLQTASPSDVGSRMPAHLDRAEELARILDRAAQHMAGPTAAP